MNLDDPRRMIRCGAAAIAMMVVTPFASADTPLACNTSDPLHPQLSICGDTNDCIPGASASCWMGANWASGTTYAGGKIEVINGLRYVKAYAYNSLESYAGGDPYYAYVWSTTTAGGNVQCNNGSSYVRDYDADGQWVSERCNVTTTIRVLAYVDD